MKRFLWLGFVLCVYLICTGCGETFRPIIIPNPPTFPNPAASHSVLSINDNGDIVAGSGMSIDVSGDTDVSNANVNIHPVHAVQQTASQVLVVNQAVNGLGIATTSCLVQDGAFTYNVCPSLFKLSFNGESIANTTAITLPIYAGANFVASAPSDTLAYVTLPTHPPDPTVPSTILPSVGVVNTLSNNLVYTIPVGANPYALAVTPDKTKLYVANEGDSTISGFNTSDRSSRAGSPTLTSSAPIWMVARNDNQAVYVLEQNGHLAWLNTTSTAGPDTFTETTNPFISVPGAITMTYDPNLQRLYIPGGTQMVIVDISQSPPQIIATIPTPGIVSNPAVTANAVAVAALPDGSRAYVASIPNGGAQPTVVSISAVGGDGTTATYTYSLTSGHIPTSGLTVVVSGIASPNDAFNGTYLVNATTGTSCIAPQTCTFQTANATMLASTPVTGTATSTIANIFPQVTVVDVKSSTVVSNIAIPGFPDATTPTLSGGQADPYYVPICTTTRFRFMMAAGGDSSRAYFSSCDAGNVNIIDTATESYIENMLAPVGAGAPIPPSEVNPPQNPVFLLAGP